MAEIKFQNFQGCVIKSFVGFLEALLWVVNGEEGVEFAPPRKYLAMSEIFVVATVAITGDVRGCCWYLVGRVQGC